MKKKTNNLQAENKALKEENAKLQTVNAETLLYEPLEKPSFVVDSLIPT